MDDFMTQIDLVNDAKRCPRKMHHPKGLPNTLSRMLFFCSLMFFVFSDIFRYDITKKRCVFL